jgi:iron-sulfur cluster repair protein YtfE (RIC family)
MEAPADVIEVLLADHRAIVELLDKLDATTDVREVGALYAQVKERFLAHEAAEQRVVFPALVAASPNTSSELRTRLGEHSEIDTLLAEMRGLSPASYAFTRRVGALSLELRDHFEAEETRLFPWLRVVFSGDRLVELGDQLREPRLSPA